MPTTKTAKTARPAKRVRVRLGSRTKAGAKRDVAALKAEVNRRVDVATATAKQAVEDVKAGARRARRNGNLKKVAAVTAVVVGAAVATGAMIRRRRG